jgi:hypothetical protein
MDKYDWKKLNHLQVGKYAEYYSKMEFTLHGYQVFSSEVDDHGIDYIVKGKSTDYLEIQVKSLRNKGYIFIQKSKLRELSAKRLIVVVLLNQGELPALYLVPSMVWNQPNTLFVSRDYGGTKKSQPEWGINISAKNMDLLETYKFNRTIISLQE